MTSSSLEYAVVVGMSGQISCVIGLGWTNHIYVCVGIFFFSEQSITWERNEWIKVFRSESGQGPSMRSCPCERGIL